MPEPSTRDILEAIEDLALLTKQGFDDLRAEIKADIADTEAHLNAKIDYVHAELDANIEHVRHDAHDDYRRIQEQLTKIKKKLDTLEANMNMLKGDESAFAEDVIVLRRQALLQKQVRALQAKH